MFYTTLTGWVSCRRECCLGTKSQKLEVRYNPHVAQVPNHVVGSTAPLSRFVCDVIGHVVGSLREHSHPI